MALLAIDEVMLREPKLLLPRGCPLNPVRYVGPEWPAMCHLYTGAMRGQDLAPYGNAIIFADNGATNFIKRGVYSFPGGSSASTTMAVFGPAAWGNAPVSFDQGRTILVIYTYRGSQTDGGLFADDKVGARTATQGTGTELRIVGGALRLAVFDKTLAAIYATEAGSQTINEWHCAVGRWPAGDENEASLCLYVDGRKLAVTAGEVSTFAIADMLSSTLQPTVGRNNYTAGTTYYSHNGEIANVVVWMRDLGEQLCRELSRDPYAMFDPA